MAKVAQTALIGRDAELARVEEFLGAIGSGPVALLLEGEIGIGKTALWNQGLASSAEHGFRILRCRPVECETQLAYAALGDLLADVPESAMADLPVPQRRALEVALLRAEPEGPAVAPARGQSGVCSGCSGSRRAAARRCSRSMTSTGSTRPRRTRSRSRCGASRTRGSASSVPGAGAGPTYRWPSTARSPASASSASRCAVWARTSSISCCARDSGRRCRDAPLRASGAHPAATSTTRSRSDGLWPGGASRLDPSDELPIPASLQDLVRDRLAQLPAGARAAAQVAAALARPTVTVVDAALETSGGDLAAAIEAGVLERDGERLNFAHPLLATVAYQLLADSERRELHARLAWILDDPEERARHLAQAADGPDEAVAAALAAAARRAAARGAPDAAAELLEQARGLTPAECPMRGGGAASKRPSASSRRVRSGTPARCSRRSSSESPPGALRAHALARLGWVCTHEEGIRAGADVFFAALAEPADDVRLRIEILEGLSWCLHSSRSVPAAMEHAQAALGSPRNWATRPCSPACSPSSPSSNRSAATAWRPRDRAGARARALAAVVAGARTAGLDPWPPARLERPARGRARPLRGAAARDARERRRALAPLRALPATRGSSC